VATDVRVGQVAREVLRDGPGPVRVVQLAREVLRDGEGPVRVAQLSRQTLHAGSGQVRVAQVSRQILRTRRDAPYPNFPVRLFRPPSLAARLTDGTVVGGTSPSGDADIERMDMGSRWLMGFGETPLWSREKVLTWRKFVAGGDNGAMNVIIPLWDRRYQPFAQAKFAGSTTFGQVVWRDTQVWDANEVQASIVHDSAQFSTEVKFSFVGGELAGGEHFSVYGPRYGWRLYRLIRRKASDEDGQTWEIRPPLREWIGTGNPLNFDSPRCTMRVDGDIDAILDMLRLGRGTPTFVESFNRYP